MTAKVTVRDRALAVRPRVIDAIHDMGHGDATAGKVRFVEHAVWCARQRGMRVWKTDQVSGASEAHAMRHTALLSLRRLLEEVPSMVSSDGGVVPAARSTLNAGWVVDIWEVACDDWFRVKDAKPEPEVVEQMEALEAASPAATASLVGPPERKLSSRILDAYMNRDSDAMLDALHELEQRGL